MREGKGREEEGGRRKRPAYLEWSVLKGVDAF